MAILCAPATFKETCTAPRAARALARGAMGIAMPVADGGDDTLDVLAGRMDLEIRRTTVPGPDGRAVVARWGRSRDGAVAVIETAEAIGLRLVPPAARSPLALTSAGAGALIRAALAAGARHLLIGLGGSATCDGGLGALIALGATGHMTDGTALPDRAAGADMARLASLSHLPRFAPGVTVELLGDVTNPLLGADGAAPVFAPQKGADGAAVRLLEAGLSTLARHLPGDPTAPGSGAAGGLGFALGALGARLTAGAERVLDLLDADAAIRASSLVVTGEGRLDATTRAGKAPWAVVRRAQRFGVPVALVVGSVADDGDAQADPRHGDGMDGGGIRHLIDLSRTFGTRRARERVTACLRLAGRALRHA
ncbi:MAG: glycerate kinase [Phycisphaeraceae bacterium]|nr:glycerate kinase [Phycisphaeraceae bacterium]